jgi:hypothetical protein
MVRISEQCLGSADLPTARENVGARLARRNGAGIWWQRLSLPAEGWTWSGAVESRCGAVVLGSAYLCPALSFAGASLASPWLRFHTPLIKPGGRFSRTRLSDKALPHILLHTFAHEQLPLRSLEPV